MIEPVIYGDASLEPPTVPTHCAISGIRLQPGDAIGRIGGTPYSYGIAAQYVHELTHEKRVEIEAGTPRVVATFAAQAFAPTARRNVTAIEKGDDNG